MIELKSNNFLLNRKTLVLNINNKGYTLVLFRSRGCEGCRQFIPIFSKLENEFGNIIKFASIDMKDNMRVSTISMNTNTPIVDVPRLILYAGNEPKAKYTGNMSFVSVRSFIIKMIEDRGNTFSPQAPTTTSSLIREDSRKNNNGYAIMGGNEEEEDIKLQCPLGLIPHNTPWDGCYKKIEKELDDRM